VLRSYQVAEFAKPLTFSERPLPEPTGAQVLVKMDRCGVCHSDLHIWDGYWDLGGGKKIIAANNGSLLPLTMGHEIVGTVIAKGPEATGVEIGQRRLVFPWIGCGVCAVCKEGAEHLCAGKAQALGVFLDGGFASHVLVPAAHYLLDYGTLDTNLACTYACSGLTAYSALKKIGKLPDGQNLLIVGAGGVGLNAIAMAKAVTGQAPIVADLDPAKREAALKLGAKQAIDPREDGIGRTVMKATGGMAGAVDFAGSPQSFDFAYGLLRKAGHLVSVGLLGGQTTLSLPLLVMKGVTISGSYVGSLEELKELLALAQAQHLPALPIEVRPLDAVNGALEQLKAGGVVGRIVLSN
jgi:D-arabinose 1-dehydrogenase-like Zn-dependent alcohol dehydrogenase